MDEEMYRLHWMNVLVAVAEEGSFAAAARRLDMSPPAVTRAITALEAHLQVKLFDRTTRAVHLTDAGQRYIDYAHRIIGELDQADEATIGIHSAPQGRLAVTAPAVFGRMFVMPVIVKYLQRYPNVELSMLFFDRLASLGTEGIDVGVRIGKLPDSNFKALAVGHVRWVVCASPAYLSLHGEPGTPADLRGQTVIAPHGASTYVEWKFAKGDDAETVRLQPHVTVTGDECTIEATLEGLGIARLLSYQVAPYLASGQLRTVLEEFEPDRLPVHILHREGRYASAKVRIFVDMLAVDLRENAKLNHRPDGKTPHPASELRPH